MCESAHLLSSQEKLLNEQFRSKPVDCVEADFNKNPVISVHLSSVRVRLDDMQCVPRYTATLE